MRHVLCVIGFIIIAVLTAPQVSADNDKGDKKKAAAAAKRKAEEAADRKREEARKKAAAEKKREEVAREKALAKKKAEEAAERKREAEQKQRKEALAAVKKKDEARKKEIESKIDDIGRDLSGIRSLLNKADHDYNGLRAAAYHEVNHAHHWLEHGRRHPNPNEKFSSAKNKDADPPKQADDQLRQAVKSLRAISNRLDDGDLPHSGPALAAVRKAIGELEKALK